MFRILLESWTTHALIFIQLLLWLLMIPSRPFLSFSHHSVTNAWSHDLSCFSERSSQAGLIISRLKCNRTKDLLHIKGRSKCLLIVCGFSPDYVPNSGGSLRDHPYMWKCGGKHYSENTGKKLWKKVCSGSK